MPLSNESTEPDVKVRAKAVLTYLNAPRARDHRDCQVDWTERKVNPDNVAEYVLGRLRLSSRPWAKKYPLCGVEALIALLEHRGLVIRGPVVWTLKKPVDSGGAWEYRVPDFRAQCNRLLEAIRLKSTTEKVVLKAPLTWGLVDLLIVHGGHHWGEQLRFPEFDKTYPTTSVRKMLDALVNRGLVHVERNGDCITLTPKETGAY